MTAKQKANRERFKKVVAEAKKLKAKNPRLTQAQAVKQAWAMFKKSGKVGEYHKDTKSHNVNIKVVSGLPLSFTGQAGNVRFRVVRQIDIYGNINASVEDIDTGSYIVSADGKISSEKLADTFTRYVKKVDPYIDVKDVNKRMKRFFTQINKDVKDEQKGKKILKKAAAPKKSVKQKGASDIKKDKLFQALPPGKRKSASGKTYYEYRANRSDRGVLLGIFDTSIISDLDSLKKQYYRLAKIYHPDSGGTTAQMQQLNEEYDKLLNKILSGSKLNEEQKKNEIELDAAIRQIIDNIIYLQDITVEVIGKWLWVGASSGWNFDTTTYKVLNSAGLKYIKKAGRPYMVYRGIESKSRGNLSLDQIRQKYGSEKFEAGKGRLLKGIDVNKRNKLKIAIKKAMKALDKRPV